jgi:kanamycin kinase
VEEARVPPAALAGMEGWERGVAWRLVPEVVTWRLRSPRGEVRYLKVSRLGQELALGEERRRMEWAAPYLPVPAVLRYASDEAQEWLLTAALPGADATASPLRHEPARLVPMLARGLRRLHEALPAAACPFDSRLDGALRLARRRVADGLATAGDLHADHGGITPAEALSRLEALRPDGEDLVVCHGDYCLPNALVTERGVAGYVDLGKLGVADRWWDLAVATWSVTWNLGPGWEDLFLAAYGLPRDARRVAFYRLLYDLLP